MNGGGQSRSGGASYGPCCYPKKDKHGGKGEESMDPCEVAHILEEVAEQLGGLAKALASGACPEQDPHLRQKVLRKLRETLGKVCSGAGTDLDLACLLRCISGVAEAAMR